MKILAFTIYITLTAFGCLYSNGMPFRTNFIYKTFNPMPLEVSDIKILRENLSISIHRDFSIVNVEYAMKNEGSDKTIEYGFPVDFFFKAKVKNHTGIWNPEYIRDFSIVDDSGKLGIFEKEDSTVYPGKLKSRMIMFDKVDVARRWFFTKLKFPKGKEKNINVSYTISNTVIDFLMSDMYFPLLSDRVFTYDFSPAAYFGDGTIGELNIEIDIRELESANCEYSTEFIDSLFKTGGILKLRKLNVNLKEIKDLTIKYKMDNIYKAEAVENVRFGGEWFKSVKLTNKSTGSNIANLFDGKPTTGLFVGKGAGSSIEIAFGKDSVSFIGIINGNTTDRQSYYTYPRIKSLKIEIYSKTLKKYTGTNYLILELKDKDYSNFNDIHYGGFLTTIFDLGMDYYDDIKKIRLTVLDVYPGTKYDSVCIGELFVFKYRDLKPNKENLQEF